MRLMLLAVLVLVALVPVPGSTPLRANNGKTVVKVAMMIPRSQRFTLQEKRYNADLAALTDGRVQFRTYYGGSAGDEKTVLRKLRAGQIDAAPMGVQIISQFVRQAMVLMAPRTFQNYKQVDAVRKELTPEFGSEAYRNGFKVLAWWDAGKVRILSKKPIQTFDDLRTGRPWLYPDSPLLRAFYRMIDVTGVPLGIKEVYGGLQTDMIDTVWISSVLGMALRWHTSTRFISATPVNVVQGAFVVRRPTWEQLSEPEQKAIVKLSTEQQADTQRDYRIDDAKSYAKLLKRGFKRVAFKNPQVWEATGKQLRDRMVGRIYDRELLSRVEKIVAKYE
ncbi:MAG: TRAP transporter substrate-binding protein DctP [Myxococcales bacterium]|nr:TRAP transporter substrate-binding protein DctP [Myxococcales bacterium]MDD9967895.1 TRAP transporter substrate-binding protein DctP [Myxococcales bacterium]